MIGQFWIIAVITPIIAASFVYLFKLFETADAMRKQIAECPIWNEQQFPIGVADIQGNYDWDALVGGYYVTVERVYRIIGRGSIAALVMFILAVLTIVSSESLANVPLRGHISALTLAQVLLLVLAASYSLRVIYIVNDKSVIKGQIDLAVTRCKQAASAKSKMSVARQPVVKAPPKPRKQRKTSMKVASPARR